ncbi:ParA family protein [Pseudomonas huaxiensis]|uniref:ParA family protein n=1 Tax=Pseudomonas huaxiensis TaxID=2213017 RepID=UPI000DA68E22|nr:ParA family protein [Pseudomonas huaxiensis]
MTVLVILSTKGGVGKTTIAVNLGALAADAGLRVLLMDLDTQPTLSSYFPLSLQAPAGIYEMLALNECDMKRLVSKTIIPRLDLVLSNDAQGQLNTLLMHAPDGRLRLRGQLQIFQAHYDLIIIDTQGARSVLLESAVLAADRAVSPVTPEILAARELRRGTVQLMHDMQPFRALGVEPPTLQLLLNRVPAISRNARAVQHALRQVFEQEMEIQILDTLIPAVQAYPVSASERLPAHYIEPRKPWKRKAPAALDTFRDLCIELFPHWRQRFEAVTDTGKKDGGHGDLQQ